MTEKLKGIFAYFVSTMASGRTLLEHEEKKKPLGFFPKLYEGLVNNLGAENMEALAERRHDSEWVLNFTHDLEDFRRGLLIQEAYPEKNPYEYRAKKEYGNKAYAEGRDLDALYLYTQAVVAAPQGGKDLALVLANRSAVLFSLRAFHLAADDIRLALESGYPEELRFKLLDRRAKVETHFRQFSDARDTYKELIGALDGAKCEKDKKMRLQRDAQKMLDFFSKAPSVYNDPNVELRPALELPKVSERNPSYPALANCLHFRHEAGRGRFAVATRDIAVGEFICVEKPLVSRILPEYAGSNCANCFKSMKAPLPCPTCTKVMFCSYACRYELTNGNLYPCTRELLLYLLLLILFLLVALLLIYFFGSCLYWCCSCLQQAHRTVHLPPLRV